MDKELQDWYRLHQFHMYSGSFETKDLAVALGVSMRTVQRWLKEKSKPTQEQLTKIAQYVREHNSNSASL